MDLIGFFQEDNGKLSTKRLLAASFATIIALQIIGAQFFNFPCSENVLYALLGFIATCLGMTYIPTRVDNAVACTTVPNPPVKTTETTTTTKTA